MDYSTNYEHNGDTILFNNNVQISRNQFDALNRVRGLYTCSTPSFLWTELSRIEEGETELVVQLEKPGFNRIRKEMDFLADSGFFQMEVSEVEIKKRIKYKVTLSEIHPAIQSIIRLM